MKYLLDSRFLSRYSTAWNPLRESPLAYLLVIVNFIQLITLNGFAPPTSVGMMLRSWLEILKFVRFTSWVTLNVHPIFQAASFALLALTVSAGVYVVIFARNSSAIRKTAMVIFKSSMLICEFLLPIPVMDIIFRKYIPQTIFAPGNVGFLFEGNNLAHWFWTLYVVFAYLVYICFIPFFRLFEWPFRTVFEDRLKMRHRYVSHCYLYLPLVLFVLSWKSEEGGLSPLILNCFACVYGLVLVMGNLTWNLFQHPETHMLHGCLSAFYLSHSINMTIINQLTANTRIMDIVYFASAGFFIKIYYNVHQYIFHMPSQTFSKFSPFPSFSQLAERHTIFRLITVKNRTFVSSDSDAIHFIESHFYNCKDFSACPCASLRNKDDHSQLDIDLLRIANTKAFEELLAARLIAHFKTPESREFNSLESLIKIINYVAFEIGNPARACLILNAIASSGSKQKFSAILYEAILTDLQKMMTIDMSASDAARSQQSFYSALVFEDGLKELRGEESQVRQKYSELFAYLLDNNLVHLSVIHQKGRDLVKKIDKLEKKFESLSNLNCDSIELIDLLIRFKKEIKTDSNHSLSALNCRLRNVVQKQNLKRLGTKHDGGWKHHELTNSDEINIFLLVDLFENPGRILKSSDNFYEAFGYRNEQLHDRSTLNIHDLLPPTLKVPHKAALIKFRDYSNSLFGHHDFGRNLPAIAHNGLLVPTQVSVKIEIHNSQIYCAAALVPEQRSRNIILTDENGYIVAHTEGISNMMEGLGDFLRKDSMNICLMLPAVLPVIFPSGVRSLESMVLTNASMFMTHKQLREQSHNTNLWKNFQKISDSFKETSDQDLLPQEIRNFLSLLYLCTNDDTEEVLSASVTLKYNDFQALGAGFWEIEITNRTAHKGRSEKQSLKQVNTRHMSTSAVFDQNPQNRLTLPNSHFQTIKITDFFSGESSPDKSALLSAPDEDIFVQAQMKSSIPMNAMARERVTVLFETAGKFEEESLDSEPLKKAENNTGEKFKKSSLSNDSSKKNLPKRLRRDKEENGSLKSGSVATTSSFSSIRRLLATKNSLSYVRAYYVLGIFAALLIVVMSILQFVITNNAMNELTNLATLNIHPTQIAAYINVGMKEILKKAVIDKGLLPTKFSINSYGLIIWYWECYVNEFQVLLNDTTHKRIVKWHLENNLLNITDPLTGEVSQQSLTTTIGQLQTWNLELDMDLLYDKLIDDENYYPRLFFELNNDNIENNVLRLFAVIQDEIDKQNDLTVVLNFICLIIGCVIVVFVLLFLIGLWRKMHLKRQSILVVFCKISKKDLYYETSRLLNTSVQKTKKHQAKDGKDGSKIFSDRLSTNYVVTNPPYILLAVLNLIAFCLLILPFLICYIRLSVYSRTWGEGIVQYNMWELTRSHLLGFYSDANRVYLYINNQNGNFEHAIEKFENKSILFGEYVSEFGNFMAKFGKLSNQDLYDNDIGKALADSAAGTFCPYATGVPGVTEQMCNDYLGGIAQTGLGNTLSYVVELQKEYINRLKKSSDPASVLSEIGDHPYYEDNEFMLVILTRLQRMYSVSMHDNLMAYLDMEQRFLVAILAISIAAYLVVMLTSWTLLIRKFNIKINETMQILTILPESLLRGNNYIRNFLTREIKLKP